jgi:hypothetical protein
MRAFAWRDLMHGSASLILIRPRLETWREISRDFDQAGESTKGTQARRHGL